MSLAAILMAAAVAASPSSPRKIAVLDLEGAGVDPALAQAASLVLPTELRGRLPGVQIISSGDIRSMLGFEKTKQAIGCEDDSCMSEIGGALGVDEMVSGKMGKVGRTLVVELRRIDVRGSKTLSSAVRTVRGEEDALIQGIQEMAGELYPGTVRGGGVRAVEASGAKPGFLSGKVAAWVGAGLGVAMMVGGGVAIVDARGVASDYEAQQSRPAALATVTRADADAAKVEYTVGWAVAGAGAVVGGWGVYRILHLRQPASVAVFPIPGGATVALGGSF